MRYDIKLHAQVGLTTLLQQIISIAWYVYFGLAWALAVNYPLGRVNFYEPRLYLPFVYAIGASLLINYGYYYLCQRLLIYKRLAGCGWLLSAWLGLVFLNTLSHHQFSKIAWTVTWIDSGRDLLALLLTVLILTPKDSRLQQ
ncbi:MAG: DUF1761 domain-containing protein [Gammaproteobacteria bacterium]|nr:DUF1761 domain-containing protein [Gammaproteobacteria bacterium]